MSSRNISRAAIFVGVVALSVSAPLAAHAHITIDDKSAEPGSYKLINIKVPSEAEALTNKITLTIPEHEGLNASYAPVAGWETVVSGQEEGDGKPTTIVWTAKEGTGIGPGQFLLFPVSLGAIPDVDSLVLPVDQGYDDGTVVSWSETEEEAEKPAPVLYVNAEVPDDGHGGGVEVEAEDAAHAEEGEAAEGSESDILARVFGIAGLALGAAALVVALKRRTKVTQ